MDNSTIIATTKFVYKVPKCGVKDDEYIQTEETALFVVYMAYAIPTQILSIWLFNLIFFSKSRQTFASPFYSFFGISTIPTILFFLGDQLFLRASVFLPGACTFWMDNFPGPSRLHTIPYLLQYYPVFSHLIFSMFISANRMTAILCPAHHVKYWKQFRTFCNVLILLFPLLLTWQIYLAESQFMPMRLGAAVAYKKIEFETFTFLNSFRSSLVTMIMYAFSGVVIILTTIVTVALLVKLSHRRKDAEVQLCLVGIILAIGTGIDASLQTYIFFVKARSWQYIIRCFMTDIPFVCAPWSLLFMSSEIKKELRKALGMKVIEPLFSPSTTSSKSFLKENSN